MNKELQQQIFTRLDALANKLNITSAHIWQFYVAQARVEMWKDIYSAIVLGLFGLLLIGGALVCFNRGRTWQAMLEGTTDYNELNTCRDSWYFVAAILGALGILVLTLGTGSSLHDAITPWLNPNYWAFRHLITTILH